MPKFDKPDSPNIIWGVNALEEDLTRPDDSYIQTGWTQVKPPYEYENYSMNKLYQGFAYYNQLGFPEWDSVTEYQANKSYVQGSDNRVYKCIQTHTNRNPTTAGNESWWELFEGNRQATTVSRGTVEFATDSDVTGLTSSTKSITPSSLATVFQTGPFSGTDSINLNGDLDNTLVVKFGSFTMSVVDTSIRQTTVNFSTAFPSNVLHVFVQKTAGVATTSSDYGGFNSAVTNRSAESFVYNANFSDGSFGPISFSYIAIGY